MTSRREEKGWASARRVLALEEAGNALRDKLNEAVEAIEVSPGGMPPPARRFVDEAKRLIAAWAAAEGNDEL